MATLLQEKLVHDENPATLRDDCSLDLLAAREKSVEELHGTGGA